MIVEITEFLVAKQQSSREGLFRLKQGKCLLPESPISVSRLPVIAPGFLPRITPLVCAIHLTSI